MDKTRRFMLTHLDRLLARYGFRVVSQAQIDTVRFTGDQFQGILSRYGTRLSRAKSRGQAVNTTSLLVRVAEGMDQGRMLR